MTLPYGDFWDRPGWSRAFAKLDPLDIGSTLLNRRRMAGLAWSLNELCKTLSNGKALWYFHIHVEDDAVIHWNDWQGLDGSHSRQTLLPLNPHEADEQ